MKSSCVSLTRSTTKKMIQFFCYYSKPQGFPFTFNANTRGKENGIILEKMFFFLFLKMQIAATTQIFFAAADDQAFHDTFSTLAIVMKKTTDKKQSERHRQTLGTLEMISFFLKRSNSPHFSFLRIGMSLCITELRSIQKYHILKNHATSVEARLKFHTKIL